MRPRVQIYYNMSMEMEDLDGRTTQELSNDRTSKQIQNDRGSQQHNVDSCEDPRSSTDLAFKKRRHDRSTECPIDSLPEAILQDILSRLSIFDLLSAGKTCVNWHSIVSSCKIFQQSYDKKHEESCIVLGNPLENPRNVGLFHIKSEKWFFLKAGCRYCRYRAWLSQGAADGLMLFVRRDGKLAVVNPLTTHIRILPDIQITSRLPLKSALQRKTWGSLQMHMKLSLNIVVDPAHEKTFRVVVWGELGTRKTHVLVYTSTTDTWTTRLCSDQVQYGIFRSQTFSAVIGNTVYVFSPSRYHSVLASYDIDTGLFLIQRRAWPPHWWVPVAGRQWFANTIILRVQTIGIIAYKSELLLLTVIFGRDHSGHP